MRFLRQLLAVLLSCACLANAQGNSWDKVRYNGGTIQTKVDPKDWDNQLTVTSHKITLRLKDGQSAEIATSSVTGLSYGQEAHRRLGTMIAMGILLTPLALFGLFHKTRQHFIGIEYTTPAGKKAVILLQGHKDNYRGILMALKGATGAPVTVSENDRKYIPTGIEATAAKAPQREEAYQSQENVPPPGQTGEPGTISVSSTPDGAEVFVDGAFIGNAPATLRLNPGKHIVRVAMTGYIDWSREVSVLSGSESKLTVILEKQTYRFHQPRQ